MNNTLQNVDFYKMAKMSIYICIFYLLFVKYAYGDIRIILYGTSILATILMIIDFVISRENVLDVLPYGVLVNLVMVAYSIITRSLFVRNSTVFATSLKTYLAFTLLALTVSYITNREKNIRWFIDAIIIIDIISSAYVLLNGSYYRGYGYVLGTSQNPNNLGLAMDLGLFSIAIRKNENKFQNYCRIGIAALFFHVIVGCGSRKCLLAALIICAIWILVEAYEMWNKDDFSNKIVVIIIISLIIAIAIYYYNNTYIYTESYYRLERLGDSEEGSSVARIQLYKYALEYFLEKPFFGIGFAQYQVWNPYHTYAHSTYAEALVNWGIVGCSIYFTPIIWAGVQIISGIKNNKNRFTAKLIFSLFAAEIFLGIGQIWFYEIEHMLAWAIIYSYISLLQNNRSSNLEKNYKYVKI